MYFHSLHAIFNINRYVICLLKQDEVSARWITHTSLQPVLQCDVYSMPEVKPVSTSTLPGVHTTSDQTSG
jgi:hypothetical protein